jgi:hypothetical protein
LTAVLSPLGGASSVARIGDLFLLSPQRVICGNHDNGTESFAFSGLPASSELKKDRSNE